MAVCSVLQPMYNASMQGLGPVFLTIGMGLVLAYMFSKITQNPRLEAWVKTEFTEFFVSFIFAAIFLILIKTFCNIDYCSIYSDITGNSCNSGSIYDGAIQYLKDAADHAHCTMINARYLLGKIELDQSYWIWKCPFGICLFAGGQIGTSYSKYAGAGYLSSAVVFVMQSALTAFVSAMVHLQFVYSIATGAVLVLLPLGVFFRSVSFLRKAGAVALAICFSFTIVYPLMFAFFKLAFPVPSCAREDESKLKVESNISDWLMGTADIAEIDANDITEVLAQLANVGFYGVFLPNLALVVAIGTVVYLSGMMGGEADIGHLFRLM